MEAKIREYETLYIVDPDSTDEARKGILSRAASIVEASGGTVAVLDEWGRQKLAYPIRKKGEGYYFLVTYTAPRQGVAELDRVLGITEDVMRSQTIAIDKAAVEAAKNKVIEAKAAAEAKAKAEAEAAVAAAAAAAAAPVAPATPAATETAPAQGENNG